MDASIHKHGKANAAGRVARADRGPLWFAVALAMLAALPFLVAVHPQQSDFPSHLARYYVMLEGGGNAVLSRYYAFEWAWTGNLGVDILMWPLGRLLGVEAAARLIAMLLPPITGLAIVTVEWVLRRRVGVGSMLAFATIWSPAMQMGFANFSLSLALALFAFALWAELDRHETGWLGNRRRRAALFVPVGLAIWLCHSAGWGVLGVLVFGYEWHRRRNFSAFLAPWPLFVPILAIITEPGIGGSFQYGENVTRYKIAIWLKALADQTPTLDVTSVVLLVAAIALTAHARKLDGRLAWAAALIALLTLAMPRHFGGGDLADMRLVPVALMIGCLAIDLQMRRWMLYAASALFLVRLGVTTAAWKENSDTLEAALVALDQVPRGARIAGALSFDTARWGSDALDHAPSYATVYRDALVNTHFAVPGVHMLRVRSDTLPGVGHDGTPFADPSQRVPVLPDGTVDLSAHPPAAIADYLWYFGSEPVKRLPPGAQVLHRTEGSLLARLANRSSSR